MDNEKGYFAHPTATVEKGAKIGRGTKVWHYAHVRENASIGENCILGHCSFVDTNVVIGNRVKIGNKASIFNGVTVEDEAFIGPHVAFTNDMRPRSVGEWEISRTTVKRGASIGANSTVICGVTVGPYAMAGAGSVITRDVPPHALVYGNPARIAGFVCFCGRDVEPGKRSGDHVIMKCRHCKREITLPEGVCQSLER
jgi:acetyltransferase-like isoleucine patch superfamily enzyme